MQTAEAFLEFTLVVWQFSNLYCVTTDVRLAIFRNINFTKSLVFIMIYSKLTTHSIPLFCWFYFNHIKFHIVSFLLSNRISTSFLFVCSQTPPKRLNQLSWHFFGRFPWSRDDFWFYAKNNAGCDHQSSGKPP